MIPAFPKPGQVRKVRPAVKVYRDGREACDLKLKAGREEYFSRIYKMLDRQAKKCRICGQPLRKNEAVFEHEDGRGHGGGHRDDRIEVEVTDWDGAVRIKRQNGAAHPWCNSKKGSAGREGAVVTSAQKKRITEDYAHMYVALQRIAAYMTPERLRECAEKKYGLEPDEALEMAYENIIEEGKAALREVRKPFKVQSALGGESQKEGTR